MEDFDGLASSLAAGVSDVRGCLILSRDGMVLGAHPYDGEAQTRSAWMRFAAVGDPERGFTQFGTETWCYVRRGPYAAFAIVGVEARPGLVIDHMEQVLLAAEETRNSREGVRAAPVPAAPAAAPTSKPRTPLHPEPPLEEPVVITADVTAQATAAQSSSPLPDPVGVGDPRDVPEAPAGPAEPVPEPVEASGEEPPRPWTKAGSQEGDVDTFSLAREFGQLLQEDEDGADG